MGDGGEDRAVIREPRTTDLKTERVAGLGRWEGITRLGASVEK